MLTATLEAPETNKRAGAQRCAYCQRPVSLGIRGKFPPAWSEDLICDPVRKIEVNLYSCEPCGRAALGL